jgi:hypothetical protein
MPRLTDDEIQRQIGTVGLLRLATIAADGSPSVVPLGYLHQDGQIMLTAREKVAWLADIRRDPRVCLSIDSERYPLRKVTIRGQARILFEPGEDDEWRDRRLPMPDPDGTGPVGQDEQGRDLFRYDEAYRRMTHDDPRALVAIAVADATVTSWRMPVVGESLSEVWAARYYHDVPKQWVVAAVGRSLHDVLVVEQSD